MAKPSDVNNLISSYQSEQEDIQNYQDNPDPSTASIGGSITENVEQTIPFQKYHFLSNKFHNVRHRHRPNYHLHL